MDGDGKRLTQLEFAYEANGVAFPDVKIQLLRLAFHFLSVGRVPCSCRDKQTCGVCSLDD